MEVEEPSQTRTREPKETEIKETETKKVRTREATEAAKTRSLEAKAAAQQRKLAVSQKKCETMKTRLSSAVPKLNRDVQAVKKTLDKNFARIQTVHDDGKQNAADYDALRLAAQNAKESAETSIGLIDPASVTVDCTSSDLGTQLDSYRSTVKEARTSLKQYRTALVDLISAMNASTAEKTADTAEGGAQ